MTDLTTVITAEKLCLAVRKRQIESLQNIHDKMVSNSFYHTAYIVTTILFLLHYFQSLQLIYPYKRPTKLIKNCTDTTGKQRLTSYIPVYRV
jgi:hypothetical protein